MLLFVIQRYKKKSTTEYFIKKNFIFFKITLFRQFKGKSKNTIKQNGKKNKKVKKRKVKGETGER